MWRTAAEADRFLMAAVVEAVQADVLSAALYARFRSRQEHTFAEKVLLVDAQGLRRWSEAARMIPKSGNQFSEKIIRKGVQLMAASKLAAVVVMGVSGAGKSTVGKLIRRRSSGCPFRDAATSFQPQANIEKMSRGEPADR